MTRIGSLDSLDADDRRLVLSLVEAKRAADAKREGPPEVPRNDERRPLARGRRSTKNRTEASVAPAGKP